MSKKITMKLGKKIRKERLKRKLTQEKLALLCGISSNYISEIEKGRINLTIKILHKIAKQLQLRTNEFF